MGQNLEKEPLTRLNLKTENDWRHPKRGIRALAEFRASNSEPNS